MRAASLAVGCLAALPFLDPRSLRNPASQRRAGGGGADAVPVRQTNGGQRRSSGSHLCHVAQDSADR